MLKIGVIGCTGRGEYGHGIDAVWKDIPGCQVVAVADSSESGRAKAVERTGASMGYADYREMLAKEQLDIVAIGPRWIDQHRDMVLAAVESGRHVYMEKPFCRTPAEADEIVTACEMRHRVLAIAHQSRWVPLLPVLRKELKNGLIGRVVEARLRGKEDRRGGAEDLWVLGSHVLDMARALLGDPTECTARIFQDGVPAAKIDLLEGAEGLGPLLGDSVHALFSFPGGVTASFDSVRNVGGSPSRFGLRLFGTEGVIEWFSGYPGECRVLRDPTWGGGRSTAKWEAITSAGVGVAEPLPNSGLHGGNVAAVTDLLACIQMPDRRPQCSMYDARWTIEMIHAIFASHSNGHTVALPLQDRNHGLSKLMA